MCLPVQVQERPAFPIMGLVTRGVKKRSSVYVDPAADISFAAITPGPQDESSSVLKELSPFDETPARKSEVDVAAGGAEKGSGKPASPRSLKPCAQPATYNIRAKNVRTVWCGQIACSLHCKFSALPDALAGHQSYVCTVMLKCDAEPAEWHPLHYMPTAKFYPHNADCPQQTFLCDYPGYCRQASYISHCHQAYKPCYHQQACHSCCYQDCPGC